MKTTCLLLAVLAAMFVSFTNTAYAQTPQEELEQKKENCDFTDPEAVFELAQWAMKSKNGKVRREGRKYMKEVLDLDEDHEGARKLLGYVKVGDEWYKKKEAQKARKKLVEGKMKERGFVWFKNGWIKKTQKRAWNNKWEKDDEDIWHSYEDVMRAKGYSLFKGTWVRMDEDDRKRMEFHRKNTGEDILIISSQHWVIHTSIPIKMAQKYSDLAEKVYDWYMKEFNIPQPRSNMFLGQKAHIWTFETNQQFQDWVTTYSDYYKFDDDDKKQFRERPSGWLLPNKRILTIVSEEPENIENTLLHQIGVILQVFNIRGTPAWMNEGFGHLVEELFSGIKFGRVNMSTRAKYAGGGGIASKEYNTKDGRPQTKGLVKAGEDIPIEELSKKTLNTLDPDNLAQGFSLTEWLFNHNKQKYMAFVEAMKKARSGPPSNVIKAITEGMGMSAADVENAWRKYVKKKYK